MLFGFFHALNFALPDLLLLFKLQLFSFVLSGVQHAIKKTFNGTPNLAYVPLFFYLILLLVRDFIDVRLKVNLYNLRRLSFCSWLHIPLQILFPLLLNRNLVDYSKLLLRLTWRNFRSQSVRLYNFLFFLQIILLAALFHIVVALIL